MLPCGHGNVEHLERQLTIGSQTEWRPQDPGSGPALPKLYAFNMFEKELTDDIPSYEGELCTEDTEVGPPVSLTASSQSDSRELTLEMSLPILPSGDDEELRRRDVKVRIIMGSALLLGLVVTAVRCLHAARMQREFVEEVTDKQVFKSPDKLMSDVPYLDLFKSPDKFLSTMSRKVANRTSTKMCGTWPYDPNGNFYGGKNCTEASPCRCAEFELYCGVVNCDSIVGGQAGAWIEYMKTNPHGSTCCETPTLISTPTTAPASYVKVNNKGCGGYVHMDTAKYGADGGQYTVETCAEAVRSFDGTEGCKGAYFFFEYSGRCGCPTDDCTIGSNRNAGGDGDLYKLLDRRARLK